MSERILNFSEFFGKYSKDSTPKATLDSFMQSSTNFEEGFDDSTYNQAQLGPNRPVSSNHETTPPLPGEIGTPAFNSNIDNSFNSPEESEVPEIAQSDSDLLDNTEETKKNDIKLNKSKKDSESNDDSSDTIPEPELGANPKNEAHSLVDFNNFISERYDTVLDVLTDVDQEDSDEDFDDSLCQNCGIEIGYSPEGATCGCNM